MIDDNTRMIPDLTLSDVNPMRKLAIKRRGHSYCLFINPMKPVRLIEFKIIPPSKVNNINLRKDFKLPVLPMLKASLFFNVHR